MRKLLVGVAMWVLALGLCQCHQSSAALSAPQPGAPCGVGVPCYDGNPPVYTHECCWQGSVCGGTFPNIGCPSDACCAEGSGDDFATRRPVVVGKKWKAPETS